MKTLTAMLLIMFASAAIAEPNQPQNTIEAKVKTYFDQMFASMKAVADKNPTVDTFRDDMKSLAENTKGFYGGTLVDPDFVIRQVYYKTHFLAKGYDLKKVPELKDFIKKMKDNPSPQLSEPGHGSIMQPRLIAMRYPVIKNKKVVNIVSIMVRTPAFLEAVGLDKCTAYRITCLGTVAEEKGELSNKCKKFSLSLPATEWLIEYE
jgi:hypothetical protein